MRDSYSSDEFEQLMKPWKEEERRIAEERLAHNFSREKLEVFAGEAAVMKAVLHRLIPQTEGVDLVGFFDRNASRPLGRGDKSPGMPDEPDYTKIGLAKIEAAGFLDMGPEQQDRHLRDIQEGKVQWPFDAKEWFERFLRKAVSGYYAHPRVWMRIGFPGSAYPEGYSWVGTEQVKSRHERVPGWDVL